jgi:hypothetical protein
VTGIATPPPLLDFEIRAVERFGLLGPIRAGKTTPSRFARR